jgi:hypothetical protein
MQRLDSPYTFVLVSNPNQQEFFITAMRVADMPTMRQAVVIELRFLAHGQSTDVEMRKGAIGGGVLERDTLPLIEHCSQQVTTPPAPDADGPRPSAAPTPVNPTIL